MIFKRGESSKNLEHLQRIFFSKLALTNKSVHEF